MACASGYIYGINGPVVKVKGSSSFKMQEMVYVGNERLVGEVIGVHDDDTVVQVYEDTAGLTLNEPVKGSGSPLSITLAPGMIGNIYDGIERPLMAVREKSGAFIARGVEVTSLDEKKKWHTEIKLSQGQEVHAGDIKVGS